MGWFAKAYWTLAGCGLAYVLGVLSLTHPIIQRNAIYAHNINPTRWQNISNVEAFGFLRGQVTPFTVKTPDHETIFAWHILPAHVYKEHETELKEQDRGVKPYEVVSKRPSLQLLLNDPNAILMVTFHGNAGHLASAIRPAHYQNLLGLSTPSRPIHVIAFDYRGFGLSTGIPSEEGVTLDAITLLSAITGHNMPTSVVDMTNPALQSLKTSPGVDPSRIIILGQSLGTFVSTSFYHAWTLQLRRPPFKALILLASFRNLPKLLESYSIKGITPPLLSPLLGYPRAQTWLMSKIVDKWDTASRLAELARAPDMPLDLTIVHALDDWEIPWREGRGNFEKVLQAVGTRGDDVRVEGIGEAGEREGERENVDYQELQAGGGKKIVRWERVARGGHNRVASGEPLKVAVLRVLDGDVN